MYGIDISHYQKDISIPALNSEFVIVKATEGIGYKDPSFDYFCSELEKTDKLVGFYHFARPDKRPNIIGMEQEADWFIEVVRSTKLYEKAILVLDWEREPFDKEELVAAWLDRVYARTRKFSFIYGSRSKLNNWSNWGIMNKYPIWMAIWPNTKNYEEGIDPGLDDPITNFKYKIWQYSSTGRQAGKNFNIDLDYTDMTLDGWYGYANYLEIEDISDDMEWAIEMGLFKGYPDGKYHPHDPLTREQAASVLRRYTALYLP